MRRLAALAALVTVAGCAWRQAAFPLGLAERLYPEAVFRLPAAADDPFVVLTIDDAPSSMTGEILRVLDARDAGATFFVHTDRITNEARDGALKRAVAEGHELAFHMPEDVPAPQLAEPFADAFARGHRRLSAFGGGAKPYYRPPRAVYDAKAQDAVLAAHGYDAPLAPLGSARRYVLGSFLPWDAAAGATDTADEARNARLARRYAAQVTGRLFPGAIVVFHDGEYEGGGEEARRTARPAATLVSLDAFLAGAQAKGYDVVTLSDGIARAKEASK